LIYVFTYICIYLYAGYEAAAAALERGALLRAGQAWDRWASAAAQGSVCGAAGQWWAAQVGNKYI